MKTLLVNFFLLTAITIGFLPPICAQIQIENDALPSNVSPEEAQALADQIASTMEIERSNPQNAKDQLIEDVLNHTAAARQQLQQVMQGESQFEDYKNAIIDLSRQELSPEEHAERLEEIERNVDSFFRQKIQEAGINLDQLRVELRDMLPQNCQISAFLGISCTDDDEDENPSNNDFPPTIEEEEYTYQQQEEEEQKEEQKPEGSDKTTSTKTSKPKEISFEMVAPFSYTDEFIQKSGLAINTERVHAWNSGETRVKLTSALGAGTINTQCSVGEYIKVPAGYGQVQIMLELDIADKAEAGAVIGAAWGKINRGVLVNGEDKTDRPRTNRSRRRSTLPKGIEIGKVIAPLIWWDSFKKVSTKYSIRGSFSPNRAGGTYLISSELWGDISAAVLAGGTIYSSFFERRNRAKSQLKKIKVRLIPLP